MIIKKFYIGERFRKELERQGLKLYIMCKEHHMSPAKAYAALHNEPTTVDTVNKIAAALGVEPASLVGSKTTIEYDAHNMYTVKPCGEAFVLAMLGDDYLDSTPIATQVHIPMPFLTKTGRYVQVIDG